MSAARPVAAPAAPTLEAVSYTHLDVYKRQVFEGIGHQASILRTLHLVIYLIRDKFLTALARAGELLCLLL